MGSASTGRFWAIDQARAVAIMFMIWAHWGPGLVERLSVPLPVQTIMMLPCRMATTAFVCVFGLTLGYVFATPRLSDRFPEVRSRFIRRFRLIAFGAVLISSPRYVALLGQSDLRVMDFLWSTYSVLLYYTLAVLSAPWWLRVIQPRPFLRAGALALAYWTVGVILLRYVWPVYSARGLGEFLRCWLLSGSYAYFQLSALAILSVPVGIVLRECVKAGRSAILPPRLAGTGVALAVIGLLLALASGEFSILHAVDGTMKAPPRAWYHIFFAGQTILVLTIFLYAGLKFKKQGLLLYATALFGQAALPIYVAHVFVRPGGDILSRIGLNGNIGDIVAVFVFGVFAAVMMRRRHVALEARYGSRSQTASVRGAEGVIET